MIWVKIEIDSGNRYSGPQVYAMILFSGNNAFSNSYSTRLIEYEFPKIQVKNTIRVGLGKNANESGSEKLTFRFELERSDN